MGRKRMNIPVAKILSARNTFIMEGKSYHAYCLYLKGRRKEARNILIREHFDTYYGKTRNITTDTMVKEMYLELGATKPINYMDSDPGIVLKVVAQRVDVYLKQFEDFQQNGYKETTAIKMSPKGENFILRSCGENKCIAMAALGNEFMPGVVLL